MTLIRKILLRFENNGVLSDKWHKLINGKGKSMTITEKDACPAIKKKEHQKKLMNALEH